MTTTRTAGKSDTGRVREMNEDRWMALERDGVTLLAVADGVGGEDGGEIASEAALGALPEGFFAAVGERGDGIALGIALEAVNTAVLAAGAAHGHSAASTTLVVAICRGQVITIANLGDSRAYLIRRGTARQVTTDHSGPRPNAITRFAGDVRGVQPDVFVETWRSGDRLVLCSDGLTRHVPDEELASIASRNDPAVAAGGLVDLANERGGEDNITVLVHQPHVASGRGRAIAIALIRMLLVVALLAIGSLLWLFWLRPMI